MNHSVSKSLIVSALFVAAIWIGLAPIQAQAGITITQFPIVTTGNAVGVALSGDNVVWTDVVGSAGIGAYYQNIYGYNLATDAVFSINADAKIITHPVMDGDTVAWAAYDREGTSVATIYGYSLANVTTHTFTIANTGKPGGPAISGSTVVYTDIIGSNGLSYLRNIYGYDVATAQTFPINTQGKVLGSLRIDGGNVVWGAYDRVGSGAANLYAYNLSSVSSQGYAIVTTGTPSAVAVSGNTVVYTDIVGSAGIGAYYQNIRGYNLDTNQDFAINTEGKIVSSLLAEGDWVVWEAYDRGPGNSLGTIYAYNLATHEQLTVCDTGTPGSPAMTDRRVVWTDLVGHNGFSPLSNIYFYDFVWGGDPFPVNMDAQVIWAPIIDGDTIVWGAYDNGNHATIYGTTIGHLPEPGTIVMFAFGSLGIAGTVVRRMRK